MREILFRGKRKDNDEWVYGFYSKDYTVRNGIKSDYHAIFDKDLGEWFEVIPETIGQYTGLADKNGNKIFEKDIVDTLYDVGYIGVAAKRIGKCVVVFNDGCFMRDRIGEAGLFYFIFSDKEEIIGNIYDNPELLRSDENEK